MSIRAKTKNLFSGKELTAKQKANSALNMKEIDEGATVLKSYPRRLVFELTNACNLNCVMCGRNAADFKPTVFDMDVFRNGETKTENVEIYVANLTFAILILGHVFFYNILKFQIVFLFPAIALENFFL